MLNMRWKGFDGTNFVIMLDVLLRLYMYTWRCSKANGIECLCVNNVNPHTKCYKNLGWNASICCICGNRIIFEAHLLVTSCFWLFIYFLNFELVAILCKTVKISTWYFHLLTFPTMSGIEWCFPTLLPWLSTHSIIEIMKLAAT